MSLPLIRMKGFEVMFHGASVLRLFTDRYAPLADVAEALGTTEVVAAEALARLQQRRYQAFLHADVPDDATLFQEAP